MKIHAHIYAGSVAVDWINDKLYWCDENASRIEVADLSGDYRKVLVDTDIQHPSNLVVDPNTRYVYEYHKISTSE